MQKIGILGGSFNPVHNGHMRLGRFFADMLGLNSVILIPSSMPPHKIPKEFAADTHRLEMCRIAAACDMRFRVSAAEIERRGKSYTFDTIAGLKRQNPSAEFYLIIGSDMLYYFDQWYRYEELLKEVTLCVAARTEADVAGLEAKANELRAKGGKIIIGEIGITDISSTEIRDGFKTCADMSAYLDAEVLGYIRKSFLYLEYPPDSSFYAAQSLARRMLADKRYHHSLAVAAMAGALAKKYGADVGKAITSGLLHDVCKELGNAEQLKLIKSSDILLSKTDLTQKQIFHAFAAERFVAEQLEITDPDIQNALRYHTTGRAGMSLLEIIVFVADKISYERNYFDVEYYRTTAFRNIYRALFDILAFNIKMQVKRHRHLIGRSIEAYNFYLTHLQNSGEL